MRISIVVPCRNEVRHIRLFLDSVLAQQLAPGQEMEILVADGMSDDGTREVLRNHPAENVHLIDNPERIVSAGLNAAILASQGEIIVRMDVHTVYAPDYIRQCVRALAESGADNAGGPWVAEGRNTTGMAIAEAFRSPFCAGGGKAHNPEYEGEVDTVYLGCWRREVFDRIGMFDTQLVRNQDDEFNFRLRKSGGRLWQSPLVKSSYTPRASLKALFRQYLQYGFWRVAVMRKHRGLAAPRQAVPALFVASLFVGTMAWLIAAVFSPRAATIIAAFLGFELLLYAVACIAATLMSVRRVSFRVLALMPVVMATYHFAYGLGFLFGLFTPRHFAQNCKSAPRLFTALTR